MPFWQGREERLQFGHRFFFVPLHQISEKRILRVEIHIFALHARRIKAFCIPGYIIYALICVYAINGARGFIAGFWQMLVIFSIMNLIDRFLIDEYWVGHTKAWIIPGTEDLRPYITAEDKKKKWIMGTVGMALLAAILSGIMALILK